MTPSSGRRYELITGQIPISSKTGQLVFVGNIFAVCSSPVRRRTLVMVGGLIDNIALRAMFTKFVFDSVFESLLLVESKYSLGRC